MSAGAVASACNVEVSGVGLDDKNHGAGAVEDAVVGVGREVVHEFSEVGLGEFSGC